MSTSQTIFATAGGGLLQVAPQTGPAAPFVAAAGAIMELLAIAGVGSGCGPTCVMASNIVDQIEPQLRANCNAYLAANPRTPELQQMALEVFDGAWNWLTSVQACGSSDLGNAGKRCISDRDRGGKFDWFRLYRDPIANDHPQPSAGLSAAAAGVPTWMLAAALILLGVLL